jgi:hypothetical protein
MGKVLDHIKDDNEALAQWIGRKLKNHDPMSKRIVAKGAGLKVKSGTVVQGNKVPGANPVYAVKGSVVSSHTTDKTKILYQTADGKTFIFSVEQVTEQVGLAENTSATTAETDKQMVLA